MLLLIVLATAGAWLWWQAREVRADWRQADDALRRHDLAAAADHLDRYLARRPNDAAGWFLAARTARRLGRFAGAEQHLTRCQQLGGVTDATRLEWDLLRIQQGDLGEVHTRLRRTITPEHPDATLVLEALAHGYLVRDRLRDVLEACDLWEAREPDHPGPWLFRGGVFERLGNATQAVALYRKAYEKAPDDRDARLALAAVLARSRQPGEAAELYEKALARSPDDAEALLGLAGCRVEQGRPADALALLDQVAGPEAGSARARLLRGKVARDRRDDAGAEGWFRQAVRQAPDDAEALHQLVLILRAQRKLAEADSLAPKLEALRKDLAQLTELTRAVAHSPDDPRPRHDAGVVALRVGRADEGVRWLQGALRLPGDHRATHAALAEHFARQGDPRAAHHRRLAGATK